MKKKLFRKKVNLNVIIFMATVVISANAVLVCSNFIYQRFSTLSNDITEQVSAQEGIEIAGSVTRYIDTMIQVSEDVFDALNDPSIQDKRDTIQFLLRGDIDTIAVFDRTGAPALKVDRRNFKAGLNVSAQPWFAIANADPDQYHLSDAHVQQLYDRSYPWVISLSRDITWRDASGNQQKGILLVDLNFSELMDRCSRQSDFFGYSFILTKNGDIVYHPYQQLLYARAPFDDVNPEAVVSLPDGSTLLHDRDNEYYLRAITLKNSNWRIYSVTKKIDLFSYGPVISWDIAIVVFLILLLTAILAAFISRIITRPLKKLTSAMNQVQQGQLSTVSNINGFSEVTALSHSFNEMMEQIQTLMAQLVKEQEHLRKSQLKALHAQINPHFLYNTLDSIVWMAHSGDREQVVEMVTALASFFRLGLSKGSEMIPLHDELKHAENYLIIQSIRFEHQFSYQIDAEPGTLACYTPNIILQPIVENAILHGIGDRPSGGVITIQSCFQDEAVVIKVTDNGYGIPPQKLKDILNAKRTSDSGLGIRNVNQRIQILFGEQYGLHYESELDQGTSVSIRLPVIDHVEEEEDVDRL